MRLTLLLDMAADGFGDRVVAGSRVGGITAPELRARALRAAAHLRASHADSLVYLAPNGPTFSVALFAAAYAGIPLVPLNYRLGEEQLSGLVARHPKAAAIAVQRHARQVAGLAASTTPECWLARLAVGSVPDEPPSPGDDDGVAAIIYTSGTTAQPKGVLLRHSHLLAYVLNSVEFAAAAPQDAAIISVPPYHIAAVANVVTNLYAGRRALALERFEPAEWFALARAEDVTNALVVPTMLARLVNWDGDHSLPSMKTLAYGGAPMPAPVIRKALQLWPHVGFVNAYGLTETSSTIAVLDPDDHRAAITSADPVVQARLGSVGRVLPAVEVEIRDADGRVQPAGKRGRIFVRGSQVSAEYAGLGRVTDENGFFDTRDEGYLDADGYLYVGGRADDTIIRGAENIAPAEIEAVLLRHPAIADVAVFGVADVEWGQRIEAAVVLEPGAEFDPDGLGEFARGQLRASKTPERFHVVSELPRTATGKLVRREVEGTVDRAASGPAG